MVMQEKLVLVLVEFIIITHYKNYTLNDINNLIEYLRWFLMRT